MRVAQKHVRRVCNTPGPISQLALFGEKNRTRPYLQVSILVGILHVFYMPDLFPVLPMSPLLLFSLFFFSVHSLFSSDHPSTELSKYTRTLLEVGHTPGCRLPCSGMDDGARKADICVERFQLTTIHRTCRGKMVLLLIPVLHEPLASVSGFFLSSSSRSSSLSVYCNRHSIQVRPLQAALLPSSRQFACILNNTCVSVQCS